MQSTQPGRAEEGSDEAASNDGSSPLLTLPVLCGAGLAVEMSGLMVLSTSGASVNAIERLLRLEKSKVPLAVVMARWASLSAAAEFVAIPVIGRASDLVGRKPVLVGALALGALSRFWRGRTRKLWLYNMYGVLSMTSTAAFMAGVSATFADKYRGLELAKANATLGAFRGVGFMLRPILLGRLVGSSATTAFQVSGGLTFAVALAFAVLYTETHSRRARVNAVAARRKAGAKKDTPSLFQNPLAFMQFFKASSPRLGWLALANVCQEAASPPTMSNVGQLFVHKNLKLTPALFGQAMVANGAVLIAGPILARRYLLQLLSGRSFTLMGSTLKALSLVMKVWGSQGMYYMAMLPEIVGSQRAVVVDAEFTTAALESGMGPGEVAGARANLMALLRVVAPIVYGYAYAKHYRAPFYMAAVSVLVGNAAYARSLSQKAVGGGGGEDS